MRPEPGFVNTLSSSILPGLSAGLVVVVYATSYASLIYQGPLESALPVGLSLILAGLMLTVLVLARFSSLSAVVAAPQDVPAAILGLWAVSLPATLMITDAGAAPTVVVAIALSSMVMGGVFFLLGGLRLGKLVRYLPFPVVAGFIAGTGWLIFQGGLSTLAQTPFSLEALGPFRAQAQWDVLVAGAIVALVLIASQTWIRHRLAFPLVLLVGLVAFQILMPGRVMNEAGGDQGTLATAMRALPPLNLDQVDWALLQNHWGSLLSLVLISVVALLLNASALELMSGRDGRFNKELRAAGVANLLGGLVGGMPAFHSVSASGLAQKLGTNNGLDQGWLPGLVAALVCAVALLGGDAWLALAPRPLLGGLLLFLGLSLLNQGLGNALRRALATGRWGDLLIGVVILISIELFGFLESVSLGLFLALLLFVIDYARIDVIRSAYTGAERSSNVDRSDEQQDWLHHHGGETQILELHGYLFFGTAERLLAWVRDRLREGADEQSDRDLLRYLILDFRRVTGVDSSALHCFRRIAQLSRDKGFSVFVSDVDEVAAAQLPLAGHVSGASGVQGWQRVADLDHALEWAEEMSLEQAGAFPELHFEAHLAQALDSGEEVDGLLGYMESRDVEEGELLLRCGQEVDALYLVESGGMDVMLVGDDGQDSMRVRALGAGSIVGELGVYLGTPASANVRVTEPGTVWRLAKTDLERMERQDPELATAFHKWLAGFLATRLLATNRSLRALSA